MALNIQRIEVAGGRKVDVLIADEHGSLPADKNSRNNEKAAQATDGILFDESRDTRPNREKVYACLWDRQGPQNSPVLRITVRDLPSRCANADLELCFNYSRWAVMRSKTKKQSDVSSVIFDLLLVTGDPKRVPFGFLGTPLIQLRVAINNEVTWIDAVGNIDLEFYCLSAGKLAPGVFGNGIPLQLLRMFVLPVYQQREWINLQAGGWVELVASIVHGTRTPFDGEQSRTENHWLRYNSVNGAFAFSGSQGGTGLNIQAWLDMYRHWETHREYTDVNCYDQAAITEIALSLGISHDCIHWEYHQVYGFIRENAQLVGWGSCNNPYFERETKSKVLPANHHERQPFRNHAYLSWTDKPFGDSQYDKYNADMTPVKTYEQYVDAAQKFEAQWGQMRMIDACAGPHPGNETRAAYESSIEKIEDPANSFSDYVRQNYQSWTEQHYLGPGITKAHTNPISTMLDPDRAAKFPAEFDRINDMLTGPSLVSSPPTNAVQILLDEFRGAVDTMRQAKGWADFRWLDIRPWPQALGFDWAHPRGSILYEAHCRFVLAAGRQTHHNLSLRISATKGDREGDRPEDARKELAFRLAYKTLIHTDLVQFERLTYLSNQTGLPILGRNNKNLIKGRRAFTRFGYGLEVEGDIDDAAAIDQLAEVVAKKLVAL